MCGGLYDSPLHSLLQSVLASLRYKRLLHPGDRVGIAVSGGADSVALFRVLLQLQRELGIVPSVIHFNHQLRGEESEADKEFVRNLANSHELQFHTASGDVAALATEFSLSLEAAARKARYEFFWSLLQGDAGVRFDKIATAHTLDDQAETVLLRLIRGTGMRGLRGIQPRLTPNDPSEALSGAIVRPLLHIRRHQVESYLADLGQTWREDSSNSNLQHTRNRVRYKLMPLLEGDFNPGMAERLSEFAEIARAEEAWWQREIPRHLPVSWETLAQQPLALQRRLVRHAAEQSGLHLAFREVEEVLGIVGGGESSPPACNLPSGWRFVRQGCGFGFVSPPDAGETLDCESLDIGEFRLPVPGVVAVAGTDTVFEARRILLSSPLAGYNPENLYAPQALPEQLLIRAWRPGDRFWPAHTKAAKKLKELFQTKRVAAELRASWPVMVGANQELIWVRGFAAPAHLRPSPGDREAILIVERETSNL